MARSFYFNINYRCNSNCLFCAARDTLNGAPRRDMSPYQFKDSLVKYGIRAGDNVVINGGEPTIHKNFFSFLRIVKEFRAYPILFTNGLLLNDKDFAVKLLDYQPINIRIPFFGASVVDHDTLTGNCGNFSKSLTGFANIIELVKEGASIELEAKLLLSQATYRINLDIVKLLIRRFPDNYYFSINQLIFSEKVLKNKDLFIERFSVMKKETIRVIEYILKNGFYVSLNQLPFCLFYDSFPELFPSYKKTSVTRLYFDTTKTEYGNKSPLGSKYDYDICSGCSFYGKCSGFYPEYLKTFGTDEIIKL